MEAMLKLKEMPRTCDDCPICTEDGWCQVTNNHADSCGRRDDCPLEYIKDRQPC